MFRAAQWYDRQDRCGALYLEGWSLHWCLRGPVIVTDEGKVETLREQPRRCLVLYRKVLYRVFELKLWRHGGYCEHGFRKTAWWHRCDYVTADNPDGRPSDEELWPEDAAFEAGYKAGLAAGQEIA